MKEVSITSTEKGLNISLVGRIDSNNAREVEEEIFKVAGGNSLPVVVDVEKLDYISSAGLRVILHLKKTHNDMRIINANTDVYDILEMTGFTEMINVEKAYRVVSVEGCEEIGRGANGTVYRIDKDNVVKVYNNADALSDIQHEREVARIALVLGIPTAISYDVVKVGNSYGSVFELLNARPFSNIIADTPEKMDWCVKEYTDMLKKIHGTVVPKGKLPDMKETAVRWGEFMKDYLDKDHFEKLMGLINAVPHDDHMLHGDYHTKNLELQGDEVLLIDMDTLSVGHPIFELASIYNAFIGYSEYDHNQVKSFQGFDFETSTLFFNKFLSRYLGTSDKEKISEVTDKARIVGYTRMIRGSIRRHGLENEEKRKEIELWKGELISLLDKYDTLLFLRNELETDAKNENLSEVLDFVEQHLNRVGCAPKVKMQITVAVEEIFVNIANYAYAPKTGKVTVRVEVTEEPLTVTITFMDDGKPFDPTAKADPNITLSADERDIGGLGIFMTKKIMDDVCYEYVDGKNILTLKKGI